MAKNSNRVEAVEHQLNYVEEQVRAMEQQLAGLFSSQQNLRLEFNTDLEEKIAESTRRSDQKFEEMFRRIEGLGRMMVGNRSREAVANGGASSNPSNSGKGRHDSGMFSSSQQNLRLEFKTDLEEKIAESTRRSDQKFEEMFRKIEDLGRIMAGKRSREAATNGGASFNPSNSGKGRHESGIKEGNMAHNGIESSNKSGEVRNTNSGEIYYSQYLNGAEGPSSSSGQKDIVMVDNGCGFSGSKEGFYLSESWESLRAILLDPITGTLMEDAMILPCGHSFGSGGIQQIVRMKACYTCSQPVSEDLIAPNLSLRLAVQALRREEELQVHHTSKRRRDRYDLHKGTDSDSMLTDQHRGRGVQFPFAVTDHVIIKGNKRTPQRFVGREAIVTTQCLNGWYVVKTLDNAESVKLQYRSLDKVVETPTSKTLPIKTTTPNWL